MGISYEAAVHAVEIAAISLTTFNGFAAGLVVILALVDNYRHQKSWSKISIETRAPLYLAICILFSHIVFAVRESRQLGSGIPISEDAGTSSQLCITTTETSWWGKLCPL
jgi:Na+-transporting NADH:ubiquinone oxidoreductase subunit NqrE